MPEPRHCDVLLKGTVITMDGRKNAYLDGFVAIRGGKIVGTGKAKECDYVADRETIAGPQFLIIPGLVNTHAHLVQGCIRGMAEGTKFEERLFGFYYPMTGACDEQRSYTSAIPPILELAMNGVTTTVDDHFSHKQKDSVDGVLRAINDVGMRCRFSRLIINDPETVPDGFRESVDEGLKEVERVKKAFDSDTVIVTTSSIGIAYCGKDDLKPLWEWTQQHHTQFDVHAPAAMDRKYLPRRGWTKGSFQYLDSIGILSPNVISAHSQMLAPGEYDLIRDRGATVALVPDMELWLGMVAFDCRNFLDRNVPCGIGLDGPVVSYHHNLWYGVRQVIQGQRLHDRAADPASRGEDQFGSAELALEMATIGGARALMMDDRIGSLETGKQADVAVLDMSEALHLTPPAGLIAQLVYGGGSNREHVKHVYVGGKKIVSDGRPVKVDVRKAVQASNELQKTLLEETGATRFVRQTTRWNWI